jgi:D-glycero-D-manno-heptose 1,7-bisphosphate phosphatase
VSVRVGPRRAVFFDRDGTLNVDHGYVHDPAQFAWIPGAVEAVRACNAAGLLVFVITNQAGVAHGYYPESAVTRLHDWMAATLHAHGARIDAFEYCPHHPEARLDAYRRVCSCRKPAPGMIHKLGQSWSADVPGSIVIGDKPSDVGAAEAAGARGFLYTGGRLDDFLQLCLAGASPRADRDGSLSVKRG